MKDQIQLHEIAGYLPYGVKCQYKGIVNGADLKKWDSEINLVNWSDHADYIKEFPRPQEELKDKIALIKDIKFYRSYFKVGVGIYHGHLKYFINGVGFKPILRPMSDLTKEITYNSEKFVPLKKLHELIETNYFHSDDNLKCIKYTDKIISCESLSFKYSNNVNHELKHLIVTSNMGDLVCKFGYDENLRRFYAGDTTRSIVHGTAFQINLFQKLYEWHLDIHTLIGRGLAIDINTLKP